MNKKIGIVLLIIALAGVVIYTKFLSASSHTTAPLFSELHIPNSTDTIHLEVADTPDEQTTGLSLRASLAKDQALLFVFNHPDYWEFWMKDMKFNLDMIWLDKNFRVVYIVKKALPSSYPTIFTSTSPAQYVLEANAGFTESYKITVGTQLNIK